MKSDNFNKVMEGLKEAGKLSIQVKNLAQLLNECKEDCLNEEQTAWKILDYLGLCKVYFIEKGN
jgi:hypothetical protein